MGPVDDLNEEEFEDEDDLLQRHEYDFIIANVLRTKVIPKALLYFLGEEVDDDDFDDDDDDDDDVPPPRRTKNSRKTANMVKASDTSKGLPQNSEECKQS